MAGAVAADVVVATFEDGVNLGGWTYRWFDQPTPLTPAGGNPGGMLRQQFCCDSFSPRAHTVGPSAFTGDYRAEHVLRISVDARVFALDPVLFPLSLRLETNAGTPADPADDFAAFFTGGPVHQLPPASGPDIPMWKTIHFLVPSQSPDLPPGWELQPFDPLFGSVPPRATWDTLIAHVTGVSFEYGPIQPVWPTHYWDLAVDNIKIVRGPVTGDVNGDSFVDVDDLIAVILAWGPCPAPPAECPADGNDSGAVDVDDLVSVILSWS